MPKIKTGKLKGKTIAGPSIELFPKDKAPARAPNSDITGVPNKRLINKIVKLSGGRNKRKTTVEDKIIIGNELKIQLTNIFIRTKLNVVLLKEKNISNEPSSKSSLKIFWIDNNVDKSTQIQVIPGANNAKSFGSLDKASG